MTNLKMIGEFDCANCKKPIKIDQNVDICNRFTLNIDHKKCPFCNYLNTITVDIRLTAISEDECRKG